MSKFCIFPNSKAEEHVEEPLERIDWTKCIVCQEILLSDLLQCPNDSKRTDIGIGTGYKTFAGDLTQFSNVTCLPLHLRTILQLYQDENLADILQNHDAKWHKSCRCRYNQTKYLRAEKRKILDETEPKQLNTRKATRNSLDQLESRTGIQCNTPKQSCFFCGESGDLKLHNVTTFNIDEKVRQSALVLEDTILLAKLSVGDMIAQGALYHKQCLTALYRRASSTIKDKQPDTTKQLQGIALAELLTFIQDSHLESEIPLIFKLVDLKRMYTDRLRQLGVDISNGIHSSDFKDRILTNIPELRAYKQGRDVLLAFNDDVGPSLKTACERYDSDAIILAKAAKIVRNDILQHEKTVFQGSFKETCQQDSVPESLKTLVGMIMCGSNIETQSNNPSDIQSKLTIAQLLRFNCTIRRRKKSTSQYHGTDRELPLPVYLGFLLHAKTRKRELVDKLCELGLSISYDRLLILSNELGSNVCDRFEKENVVCPAKLRYSLFTTSAIDNIDHNPSSTRANGAFHGTAISIFQHPSSDTDGEDRDLPFVHSESKRTVTLSLPQSYQNIVPITLHSKEPPVPATEYTPNSESGNANVALLKEHRWLNHVKEVMDCGDENLDDRPVSWSAFNASEMTSDLKAVSVNSLLPLFEEQAHSATMIHHGMKVIKQNVDHLNPGQVPVIACDQPLYTLSKIIQWNWPDTHGEDKLVIMFGGLHIEMAALKAIGKWLDGSGWVAALEQSGVATPGVADSFIHGSHVSRTLHAHQVTACSLYILMHRAYDDYVATLNVGDNPEELETWCKHQAAEHPHFQYWYISLQFELDVLIFLRSLREGNFELYRESLGRLLPWYFALDHPNYSRWLSVHLRDMQLLESIHPTVYTEFMRGNFVVHKTHRRFSALPLDHAHEQNNKLVKGDGGAIGLTQDNTQLMRWMVSGPEVARMVNEFEVCKESIKQEQSRNPDTNHHEQTQSDQSTFKEDVSNLCKTITKMGNPFEESSKDLLVLDSRNIVDPEIAETIASIQDLGKQKHCTFVDECLVKRSKSLFDPIKQNKLPLFHSRKPKTMNKHKLHIASLKKTCTLFSQMYISCQRREGNMAEFFCHENVRYPPALSQYGDMRSGSKSDILPSLENHVSSPTTEKPEVDIIVLDGAAIINMLKPGQSKTFSEYAQNVFTPYVKSQLKSVKRVDIVWDEYRADSLKAGTRTKRGTGTRRRVEATSKIPGNWHSFLRIDDNKTELFAFLSEESMKIVHESKEVVSTHGENVLVNYDRETATLAPCTQEEADTRMLLHVQDASQCGYKKVMVRTVDTDVVILCIALYPLLNITELWVNYGTGKTHRYIPAHLISTAIGQETSRALLLLHSFTGCDQTSFFYSKGKKSAWEVCKVFPKILHTFSAMSTSTPTDESLKQYMPAVERFVVLLYDRASTCINVNAARREIFVDKGRAIELLPPTSDALLQHTKRAVYQAVHVWGRSLECSPRLPDPSEWGWEKGSEQWLPVWITIPEASKACDEFKRCNCKVHLGCKGHCQCVRSGVPCTALCKCSGDCERN